MTTNWGGNYTYRASVVHRPSSLDELSEIVRHAERVRVLGTRHSFSDIADAPELISLDALPGEITIEGTTVTVPATLTYSQLAERLREEGLALRNLASLPHISVGGAIATATHGSGNRKGNLATQVSVLELMTLTLVVFVSHFRRYHLTHIRYGRNTDDFGDIQMIRIGVLLLRQFIQSIGLSDSRNR